MRQWMALTAALGGFGVLLLGCRGGQAGSASAAQAGFPPGVQRPGRSLTIHTPSGLDLQLKPAESVDVQALEALGLKPYPNSAAYSVDVAAMLESIAAKNGPVDAATRERARKLRDEMASGVSCVFQTGDTIERIRDWCASDLSGWAATDVQTKNGVREFDLVNQSRRDVACGVTEDPSTRKRYWFIIDETRLREGLAQAGSQAR